MDGYLDGFHLRTSKNSSSKSSRRILSKHIYNSLPGEFKSFPALLALISHWSHQVLAFISSCVMEGSAEQPEEGVDRRKWLMDRNANIPTSWEDFVQLRLETFTKFNLAVAKETPTDRELRNMNNNTQHASICSKFFQPKMYWLAGELDH
jgi:hypothetical protein